VTDLATDEVEDKPAFPDVLSIDEVIDDHYQWKVDQNTNKWMYRGFGVAASVSAALFFIAS